MGPEIAGPATRGAESPRRSSLPGGRRLRALVTGGATGMGLAIARRLVDRGASVLICGRRQDRLREACRTLQEDGGADCEAVVLDLAEPGAPAAAIGACVESFGGIEILVNNAGLADYCRFEEMTAASWDLSNRVMARAPMLATQAAAPHMARAGGGRIVNNSSVSASLNEPESAQYSAAKAALVSLTQATAAELAPLGIRANAIAPGWVRTSMSAGFLAEADAAGLGRVNPLGRVGEPDEIAAVAEFLALDAPDFLTGETIYVDGGQAVSISLP